MQFSRRSVLAGGMGATAMAFSGHVLTAAPAQAGPPVKSGISWPAGHVFPTFATPGTLAVADVGGLDGFDKLLLSTLQGVVNRVRPEVYLIWDPVDRTWLHDLKVKQQVVSDPMSLVTRFRDRVRGAIVYDLSAPDAVNVATSLAGLKGCVAATAEQAKRFGLPVVDDLRGKFTDDRAAVHEWMLTNLWPQCTHRILVGLPPVTAVDVEGVTWTTLAKVTTPTHDSSNRAVLNLDLPVQGASEVFVRFSDAFPADGWGPSVWSVKVLVNGVEQVSFVPDDPTEATYLVDGERSQVGGRGNRFADGGNYFVYRFPVPAGTTSMVLQVDIDNEYVIEATNTAPTRLEPFAMFRDVAVATKAMVTWLPPSGDSASQFSQLLSKVEPGTAYAGWFANDVSGEWSGVELCSRHGVVVVAADFYANGTVLGGVRAKVDDKVTKRSKLRPTGASVYLTLTFGEGDNIQYCQRHLRELWDNPDRGSVPMNWTISPLLLDAGPAILNHFQRTATKNDFFVCGPSGAGYTYPDAWPSELLDVYTTMSGRYMAATGLDTIYAYSTPVSGGMPPRLPDRVLRSYAAHTRVRGIVQIDERGRFIAPDAPVPLIGNMSAPGSPAELVTLLQTYIQAVGGTPSKPLFIAGGVNAWNWTPTEVKQLVGLLPPTVKVVLADEFFDRYAVSEPRMVPPVFTQRQKVQASQAPGVEPTGR